MKRDPFAFGSILLEELLKSSSYFNALDLICLRLFAVSSHQLSIHFSLLERDTLEASVSAHRLSIITYFYSTKALFYHSRWSLLSACSLLPTQEMFLLSEGTEFFIAYMFLKLFLFCFSNLFIIPDCRFALSSMDMEQRDYDSRTALHVAAAEGTTCACCHFNMSLISQEPVLSVSLVSDCLLACGQWTVR